MLFNNQEAEIVEKLDATISRKGTLYIKYKIQIDDTYYWCISYRHVAFLIKNLGVGRKILISGEWEKDFSNSTNWKTDDSVILVQKATILDEPGNRRKKIEK